MLWLILACGLCTAHPAPSHTARWSTWLPHLALTLDHRTSQRAQLQRTSHQDAWVHSGQERATHRPRRTLDWTITVQWDIARLWRQTTGGAS